MNKHVAEPTEAQFTNILDRISDGFGALDRQWRITYVNNKATQIVGRTREELIGQHIWTLFPEGIDRPFYKACHQAVETQQPVILEEYAPIYDQWFEHRIYPSPDGLSLFFQDISAQKQAEEDRRAIQDLLQQSLTRLEDAELSANLGSWEFLVESRQGWWSPQMYRLFGFEPAQKTPSVEAYLGAIHPEDRGFVQDVVAMMEQGRQPVLHNFRRNPDLGPARYFQPTIHCHRDAEGKPLKFSGTLLDITARVEVEATLRQSEERYRQLFEEAPIPLLEADWSQAKRKLDELAAKGITDLRAYFNAHPDELHEIMDMAEILDVNEMIVQLYAVPSKQILLDSLEQMDGTFTPEMHEEMIELFIALSQGHTRFEQESVTRIMAEKPIHVHRVASVLSGHRSDYSRVLLSLVDITQRVEAEKTLREQARQMGLLNEIVHAALEAPSLQTMLQILADQLGALFGADGCYISQWDETKRRVIPAAAYGPYRTTYSSVVRQPDEPTMTASVLTTGHALAVEDVFNTPHMSPQIAAQFSTRSLLALPLIAGEQRLGAAIIAFDQTHRFTQEEIARGEEAAAHIALAVAKGRLLEQVQRDAAELRMLSTQLMTAQEDERREIARELHDEIGQVCTAVKTHLSTIQLTTDPATLDLRIRQAMSITDQAVERVRSMALDLRPSLLDDFGLVAALTWYVEQLVERTAMAVEFHVDPPTMKLPAHLETACFRIVQTALTNVERYALATEVQVNLCYLAAQSEGDQELELIVRDNGIGFDVPSALANAAQGASMGLLSMQERARLAGGWITFESQPTQGAVIRVRLPVPQSSDKGQKEKWV